MTAEEHRSKFQANATPVLGAQKTDELLLELGGLWGAPDVRRAASLMAAAR